MLYFIICDDETASLDFLETLVREWAEQRRQEIALTLCRSAEQFLFVREDQTEADIMLLDIDMPGMNGIDLARRLRQEGKNVQIIFVTGLSDYVLEGYDVEAVSYLIKPVDRERLFSCLDRATERCRKDEPVLLLELAGGMARVKLADICYLESDAHDTQVHCMRPLYMPDPGEMRKTRKNTSMRTGREVPAEAAGEERAQARNGTGAYTGIEKRKRAETVRSRTGIRELEERLALLGGGFFRLHRSYVVNLAYVSRIGRKEVLMDNGETLPVSRNRWEALNRAYLDYYKGGSDMT